MIDKNIEKQLSEDILGIISKTNSGEDPNTAIQKIAEDNNYSPEMIKTACKVFNKSLSASYIKNSPPEKRADTIELADPGKVISKIYNEDKEASETEVPGNSFRLIDIESKQPEQNKEAEEGSEDKKKDTSLSYENAKPLMEKYAGIYKSTLDNLNLEITNHKEKIDKNAAEAADYFNKQLPHDMKKTAQLIKNGYQELGDKILELIQAHTDRELPKVEKTAHAAVFPSGEPYFSISNIYDHAVKHRRVKELKENFEKSAQMSGGLADKAELFGIANWLFDNTVPAGDIGKRQGTLRRAQSRLGSAIRPGVRGLTSGEYGGDKIKAISKLMDEDLYNKLKEIDAQKTFTNMALYDDHLKQYDMEELADAYNDVVQSFPNAYNEPSVLKPNMLRYLEEGGYKSVEDLERETKTRKDRQEALKSETEQEEAESEKVTKRVEEQLPKKKVVSSPSGKPNPAAEGLKEKTESRDLNKLIKKTKDLVAEGDLDQAEEYLKELEKKEYADKVPGTSIAKIRNSIKEMRKSQKGTP